jgi:hypothetical protein
MKEISDVTALIVDYGSFLALAETVSKKAKRTLYYSPYEEEYRDIKDCVIGHGIEGVERCDEFMDPKILNEVDLVIFPDIGYGGLQRHLRELGKSVWGSMGADKLEQYRTKFLKVLEGHDLPTVNSVKITGLANLADHLKEVDDKWVKINRFRENMETWHHLDYVHSQRMLDALAVELGGAKDHIVFVVQDTIDTEVEIGYDGWSVDGAFPSRSFQGYEKKNELYLGSLLDYANLPEGVRYVNEKFSSVLAGYGYRNFFATELRVKDDVPYFIDPTLRMAGQTMEHQLESCENLPEVIWAGANGELIEPHFIANFAAEATLHYTAGSEAWKTIQIPEKVKRWSKLYHYCVIDGAYQFPPHKTDELGVLIGLGETIEEAIDHLKENFEAFKQEPVSIQIEGFSDLLNQIKVAESAGVEFTDQKIPSPSTVLETT